MAVGFAAAAFPDCDILFRLFGSLTYVDLHRGVTHSILMLPAWALLLAWMFSRFSSGRYAWKAIYGTAAMGIAIHIAGDIFTAYGTMVLAPFSAHRFAVPFTFILDAYFTAIIVIGLVFVMLSRRRRFPAVADLVILGCYVGFQGILRLQAIHAGKTYAGMQGMGNRAEIHAIPQPLSPFNWKIIVDHQDYYDVALVNLWRYRPSPSAPEGGALGVWKSISSGYQPVSEAKWERYWQFGEAESRQVLAREAWNQEVFAPFRRFSVFPVLYRMESGAGRQCVSFFDLRFTVPSLPPSLVFGLCRERGTGEWRLDERGGAFGIGVD
jgi:inner membrane protein